MNKYIITILICTFVYTTSIASGQRVVQHVISAIPPDEQAIYDKADQLEKAADAALIAGKYALAEKDALQVKALGPMYDDADQELASALAAEGKNREAMTVYARIFTPNEALPNRILPYALLLLKSNQWAKALDVYNRALPHTGDEGLPAPGGIELLTEDGDFSSDTPQPAELDADIHIAMGFAGIDDFGISGPASGDKALAEYRKALKLEPDSGLANLVFARGLREDGQEDAAVSAYQSVVSKYSGEIKNVAEEELGIDQSPQQLSISPGMK